MPYKQTKPKLHLIGSKTPIEKLWFPSNAGSCRIADVNRGILLPISAAVGDFTFTPEIDVESAEGLTQATPENKIKETIRQIGARVVEENVQ